MARESAESIWQAVASDVKSHYYDPKFHGLDWDALVAETKRKIDDSASYDMALLQIAATLDALNDSHTSFVPPRAMINYPNLFVMDWRSLMMLSKVRHEYGWEYEMVGEQGFVTHVRPGSDAEKKGLQVGDEILSINGYRPERATIQRANYVFNVLRPQPELKLEVKDPAGTKKQLRDRLGAQSSHVLVPHRQIDEVRQNVFCLQSHCQAIEVWADTQCIVCLVMIRCPRAR